MAGGEPSKAREADPPSHCLHFTAKALQGRRALAAIMGRCWKSTHSKSKEKAEDCLCYSSGHDARLVWWRSSWEAIPMATSCRGAGSKMEGLGKLRAFYLLPGEKGKYVSRSCEASRISLCAGREEQVGCPEAQMSSKLLGAGWEKLGSGSDSSAAPQSNQPPQRVI